MVQRAAIQGIENRLDMRNLQACANPCNGLFITRKEQVSGSSPLVGSVVPQQTVHTIDRCYTGFGVGILGRKNTTCGVLNE